MIVEILGVNGPGRFCAPSPDHGTYEEVQVGLGRFTDPLGVVPGDTQSVVWAVPVRVAWNDGQPDFRGPHVTGKRGDRHIYINWFSREPDGEVKLFRRGKVMLEGIEPSLVERAEQTDAALRCTVNLTNAKGHPTTARHRAADVGWNVGG